MAKRRSTPPWEASEAFELDRNPNVAAWVKNDHLGFEITYAYKGIIHKFRPDYLVRLANATMLVLEVKGQDSQEQQTKGEFLTEWIKVVNDHGGFGQWAWGVSRHAKDIAEVLEKHVSTPFGYRAEQGASPAAGGTTRGTASRRASSAW
ncbi:MAG: hypothetical protein HY657_17470 [Acidobacteria bacterium]|nr:hypothetical protein [Acidobacteriota bacterium]